MPEEGANINEVVTPEGRLINSSLYNRDVYTNERGQEGDPMYKVEMTFDWEDTGELYDALLAVAEAEWGADALDEDEDGDPILADDIRSPLLDGDNLAAKRAAKGKEGEAYEGMAVIRAHTKFNKHGEDGPGGVYVAGPDGKEMDFEKKRGMVYNGSYGIAAITLQPNVINDQRGITMYLRGYQFTRDGERLRSNNVASAFKPVAKAATGKGRKARAK